MVVSQDVSLVRELIGGGIQEWLKKCRHSNSSLDFYNSTVICMFFFKVSENNTVLFKVTMNCY